MVYAVTYDGHNANKDLILCTDSIYIGLSMMGCSNNRYVASNSQWCHTICTTIPQPPHMSNQC